MKGLPTGNVPIGESWEISGIEGYCSVVAEGEWEGRSLSELIGKYGARIMGDSVYRKYGNRFPLLIKFIDASQDLSIQVHPNDRLAWERHRSYGESELWYVMEAEPGAKLYSGFHTSISSAEYEKRIREHSICEVLQCHEVKAGDVFFIPAGRIHAIGKGILLAEIQQSSDITCRICDYGRVGMDGKPRPLHTEWAKSALDYSAHRCHCTFGKPELNIPVSVVKEECFIVNLLKLDRKYVCSPQSLGSFVIYVCVEGLCSLYVPDGQGFLCASSLSRGVQGMVHLSKGHSCLAPASLRELHVVPDALSRTVTLLEVFLGV